MYYKNRNKPHTLTKCLHGIHEALEFKASVD
jgi:hypothetical protein